MNNLHPNQGILIHSKYDKLVDPKTLKDHPKNRNKHGSDQIEMLASHYKYHGVRHPIIVSDRSGLIVAGHGRKLAAIRAGMTEFPAVFQDFDSDEAEYGFLIADNALSDWSEIDMKGINFDIPDLGPDFDIAMLGIKGFTLDVSEKGLTDDDTVPDDVPAVAKLGDLYQLGDHRLLCGDSTDLACVETLMDGEKAETFFSDPPYGGDVGGLNPKSSKERIKGKGLIKRTASIIGDTKIDWLVGSFENARAHLLDDFTAMVFFKWDHYQEIKEMGSCFGVPTALCVWDRVRKASAFFRFQPQHELVFHWGNQSDKKDTSGLSNVWREPKEIENKELHPTVKPIAILEPAISVTTKVGGAVLDLFGGSGSTLIACEKTNRKCFMMEIDPHYVDVIIARWEKFTGQKAEKL